MTSNGPPPARDLATLEATWTRLATIANECWVATYRSAYSTIISEALDIGCELLDARGGSLAHGARSIPVFNMIMPGTVRAVLAKYGETIEDGDVFITNDPWLCAGHLPDIAVVTPVFREGRLVAFVANVANVSDIGGNLNRPANQELFDEGLQIPVLPLCRRGERVEPLWEMILANVRTPEEVEGDLEAMMSGNALGARRIVELMDESGLAGFDAISDEICAFSEAAMRQAIEALPDGTSGSQWTADGLDTPLLLRCEVEVRGSDISVTFPDAPRQVDRGAFNCTLNYTQAHTNYALKCLLAPAVPTNAGCFRPIEVSADEGTVFNCRRPAAVDMRTRIGWQVHPLVFSALAKFLPEGVPAGCGQPSLISMDGTWADGRRFQEHLILGAGMGAWAGGAGESNSTYPSSAAAGSIEILELRSPVLVERRARIAGSGGAGRYPGGEGEEVAVSLRPDEGRTMRVVTALERMSTAPYGLAGGAEGARSALVREGPGGLRSTKDRVIELEVGEGVTVQTAGGGGYGEVAS
ncbi:MAG: 5-oxoprolinase (ATP-hydrolyzing) [Acidimicrobiaceae bacterium]|nr:5-oxoprolinase (ATP-hydrolyzing) [Acidimicrobiaceae bacterium]